MQVTAPRFEDNTGLVHLQAKIGLRWAQGAGAAGVLDYNDMFQIASVAFCIAAAGFKPENGFKFSAYYTQVALSEFRKEIGGITGVKRLNDEQRREIDARRAENERRRAQALPELPEINYSVVTNAVSLDRKVHDHSEEGEGLVTELADEALTPDEKIERIDLWSKEEQNLSPLARIIVDMLREPPDELLREVAAKRAYADECTAFGKRAYGLRDGVTITAICDFLALVGDLKKRELALAEGELMRALERIEKADK